MNQTSTRPPARLSPSSLVRPGRRGLARSRTFCPLVLPRNRDVDFGQDQPRAGKLRSPEPPTDRTDSSTSWAFGGRLRAAGLLGSMGSIGDCFDNSVAESFFGTLQLELLDEHTGTPATSSPTRSSNGSKAGTTRADGTATRRCSAPSTTRPQPRHDHPVRQNGGSSTVRSKYPIRRVKESAESRSIGAQREPERRVW
jgi:transposase InsO family protein